MEGDVDGAHGLIAVAEDEAGRTVHDKRYDGDDAKSPLQSQILDHGIRCQGVD